MILDLAFDTVGDDTSHPPVVICHGLFGSRRNFQGIARTFSSSRRILLVDMRNHGESPWDEAMTYPSMAADLAHLIQRHCGGKADVVGHSMGGKAAMTLALHHPKTVSRLIVGDIAPVVYTGGTHHLDLIRAMRAADLTVPSRTAVEDQLREAAPDKVTRAFAMHNLTRTPEGHFAWRPNLAALESSMSELTGFPDADSERVFDGPALFLRGGQSRYVKDSALPTIDRLFPHNTVQTLPDAGHWVHAEDPQGFVSGVATFLDIPLPPA